jgi:hypothetical protein
MLNQLNDDFNDFKDKYVPSQVIYKNKTILIRHNNFYYVK